MAWGWGMVMARDKLWRADGLWHGKFFVTLEGDSIKRVLFRRPARGGLLGQGAAAASYSL
jgi:hypothetical protein